MVRFFPFNYGKALANAGTFKRADINFSSIGSSLGVSHTTVRNYVELLQSTFMVEIVQPFLANTGKRLVKAPKVYISDTGITTALLDLKDFHALSGHPVFGSLWESLVLANIKGHFPGVEISFYRTSHGAEIDFILSKGSKLIAIECKASMSPSLTRGTHIAIADLNPLKTLIVSPLEKGYPYEKGTEVVSLTEMIIKINDALDLKS